jgi:hypothetical protein
MPAEQAVIWAVQQGQPSSGQILVANSWECLPGNLGYLLPWCVSITIA